jgi:hypothetical protein
MTDALHVMFGWALRLMEQHALKNVNNGMESTVNKSLGGSTYLG